MYSDLKPILVADIGNNRTDRKKGDTMAVPWTSERRRAFHTVDEAGFTEVEPGLRASRPVVRLTPSDRRCVHGYYTMSPLSADGQFLTYYEFDDPHPNRTSGRPSTGRVVVANADGSSALAIAEIGEASPSQ